MPRKKKVTSELRKFGPYKLGDLRESTIRIDLWAAADPPKSYEANLCDLLTEGTELVMTFAQTLPGSNRPLTAISISVPIDEMPKLLEGFVNIRARLQTRRFSENNLERRRLDSTRMEIEARNYWRDSAHIIRAVCGDHQAVLDFYRRPFLTEEILRARAEEPYELEPVIRLRCPAEVLGLMLRLADALQKEKSDA